MVLILSILSMTVHAADLDTNSRVILGSWYCPSTDNSYARFDFSPDSTVMWLSYQPSKQGKNLWTPFFTEPQHYIFQSPTIIEIANDSRFIIESLRPDALSFRWISSVETSYKCTRSRPPGDTDESRMKGVKLINDLKKPFLGKWKSSDGKSYVEFFPGDTCSKGFIEGGHWKIMKYKSEIYYEGRSIKCGEGSGMMERKGTNKLIEDYGMGGDPITYYRVNSGKKTAH